MKTIALPSTLGLLLAVCLYAAPAQALALKTFVASFGIDSNPCTRAAPCFTFQFAVTQTEAGGEVNCLDSGWVFGGVIGKSVTLDCGGGTALGFIVGSATLIVNAPLSTVIIRNLTLIGTTFGGDSLGIDFRNGAALYIENCHISGFRGDPGHGIKFAPPAGVGAKLYVSDSVISDNSPAASGGGIVIQPAGSGAALAWLKRVQVENNFQGILADGTGGTGLILVQVRESIVAGNRGHGIAAISNAGAAAIGIIVDRTSSVFNAASGIFAQGATVHLGNSTVTGNNTGFNAGSGGQILSYQNNQASGNFTDGAPTGVLTVK